MHLITVVIPVYNHEKFVIESIRSVIGQTYPNIELIVINDGSKDRSHEMVLTLVEECKRRFARFEYINRENRGLSATLNQALDMARGKYLSPLASDDIILPDKFSFLIESLEANDESYSAAFGNATFIDDQGRTIFLDEKGNPQQVEGEKTYRNYVDFFSKDFFHKIEIGTYRSLLRGCYLPAMSNVLKTASVREAGGWTVGNVLDDWEMWLKLSRRKKLLYIDKTVALYRVHGQNSRDIMYERMERDALMLLAREREFCRRNGLMRGWGEAFYLTLYWILRFGKAPIKERLKELRYLKPFDVPPFMAVNLIAFCSTVSRKYRPVQPRR